MSFSVKLNKNSESIIYLCSKDKHLSKLISIIGPLNYSYKYDSYLFLVNSIIEQMLSKKAGIKIFSRLEELCDGDITPSKISQLSESQIKSIGTSSSKAAYIKNLTELVINNKINFSILDELSDAEIIKQLTSIRGIGIWTAQMYLIFVLNRQDILPTSDAAFLQAYCWLYKTNDKSKEAIEKKCRKWKPYSSIAARYLYKALNNGLTKNQI